ncbi:hypothetical protein CHIBA101_0928 [Actinomyces sp. Chiba101]|nr:hypothetical protein CHIBA101_0928 [Actinomyces sp. Chiba101]GAV94238.1 hypothetical protein ADENT20671_1006 [Actinomyces denticolens]
MIASRTQFAAMRIDTRVSTPAGPALLSATARHWPEARILAERQLTSRARTQCPRALGSSFRTPRSRSRRPLPMHGEAQAGGRASRAPGPIRPHWRTRLARAQGINSKNPWDAVADRRRPLTHGGPGNLPAARKDKSWQS